MKLCIMHSDMCHSAIGIHLYGGYYLVVVSRLSI